MQAGMVCPKCGFEQTSSDSCLKCGVIISKFINHPATKQERDKIESSLEQSLGRYFTTSAKEDEEEALASFQHTLNHYLVVICGTMLLCTIGAALVIYSNSDIGFYVGLCLVPGGMVAGIVGCFIVYRCPVCGFFLWLSPKDPGYTGRKGTVQIYPPPDVCPSCNQPLK